MTTTEISSIENTPDYRLDMARIALEQAYRAYQQALADKRAHDLIQAGDERRAKASLGRNTGFSLMR